MNKSPSISRNSSFVSIRKARLKNMLSYADEDEKAKSRSSISKSFEPSAGPSDPSKKGLSPEKELDLTPRPAPPEIRAAQQLLAQIAVRILIEKAEKTNGK